MKRTLVFALLALSGCSAESEPPESSDFAAPTPAPGFAPAPAAHPPAVAAPLPPVAAPVPESARASAPTPTSAPARVPAPAAESDTAQPPSPVESAEPPQLFASAREVLVYERPSFAAKKLGYLRAGARVIRSAEPASHERCPQGFYRVAPQGYVCAGDSARSEPGGAVAELLTVRPDRSAALPYVYGRSRQPPPPLYVKLPSESEQRAVEPEVATMTRTPKGALAALPVNPVPARLAAGQQLPTPFGYGYERGLVSTGRALADSAFALLEVVQHGARKFALTSDLLLVPLDRLDPVTPSGFHGVPLSEAEGELPLAFVMSRSAFLYAGAAGQALRALRPLAYREAVFLSGKSQRVQGVTWLETRAGDWLRDERLIRVEPETALPSWATSGRSWLRVSISKQTLVAYQGEKPVYATLVSTGVDGLGDPLTTRSTVRGQFLINTKHVSVTMNSEEAGSEFDLRDVPYVQYFKDNYALHAAYWHDGFGQPRSHGCINLAPLDARWLFHWTEPPVPPAWHGAFSLRDGSLLEVVP